ncbi:GNAT family N-acetyltransferase [Agarivorans sp. QJM3NY_33]|uniref:GNAT family N-acetyltransferase n=1 Tax=Agarivorans sp. QJM3NY_33 TaxID=3421432 RepID=UPI003D7EFDB4
MSQTAVDWRVITQLDELMRLEPQWEQLADTCQASLFSQFKWIKHWLKVYWQEDWQLLVYAGFAEGQLVAVAPFYRQILKAGFGLKKLSLLAQGEEEEAELASEYIDVLVMPNYQQQALPVLSLYLQNLDFDLLLCRAIHVSSHLYQLLAGVKLCQCYPAKSYAVNCEQWSIAKLSRNGRSKWRRASKTLAHSSAVFKWLSLSEMEHYWPDLVAMHQGRWQNQGQLGAFSAARFIQFHGDFRREYANHVAMSGLFVGQKAIALNYFLLDKQHLHFYQSGWDDAQFAHCSPGFALHVWSLLHSKTTIYDFMMAGKLGGYKTQFAAEETEMANLCLAKRPWRVKLFKLINKVIPT